MTAQTLLAPEVWGQSWDDPITERAAAGARPREYVWAAANTLAALRYVDGSDRAVEWTERLGQTMHHVIVTMHEEIFTPKTWENSVYDSLQLDIVFHDLSITQVANGGWVNS